MSFPRLACLIAAGLAITSPLSAATVSLVQPARPTPDVAVTLSRLRGELWSVGLTVKLANRLPTGPSADADAVIAMVGDRAPLAVDVWLAHPPSGQPEVIRIAVDPDTKNPSEMLALRTIEVLRANLFEVEWGGPALGRPTPTPRLAPELTATPSDQPAPLGVEVGVVVLTSLDGVGPALLPTLRAGWAFRPRWLLRAAVAGFGTRPAIANPLGRARIAQHYGLIGASYRFRSERTVMPFLAFSLGTLRTSVVGHANGPAAGDEHGSQWSVLLDGGLGIEGRLAKHLCATLGVHLQVAMPQVAIHVVEVPTATTGLPNLLLVFTMGAWQ